MNTYKVSAKVANIYNNGFDEVNTTYKAKNKEKALQGFIDYLKYNRNIISFSNIKIEG